MHEAASGEPGSGTVDLTGARIAVVGASGFIGSRVVELLVREYRANVTAVVRNQKRAARIAGVGARVVEANLRTAERIESAVAGMDVVVNLAHDFRATERVNLESFRHLADACARGQSARMVHVSSIAVYDDWPGGILTEDSPREKPAFEYKNAKMAMETELQQRSKNGSLQSVILQPTIVYGPYGWLWVDQIVERLLTGTIVLPDITDGLCPAVYVDDVAHAIALAAGRPDCLGESFIISGPDPVPWHRYFEAFADVLNRDAIRYVTPAPQVSAHDEAPSRSLATILRHATSKSEVRACMRSIRTIMGDATAEWLRLQVFTWKRCRDRSVYYPTPSEVELYRSAGHCRIDKARERLGYQPAYSFDAGVQATAEYVRRKYLSVNADG